MRFGKKKSALKITIPAIGFALLVFGFCFIGNPSTAQANTVGKCVEYDSNNKPTGHYADPTPGTTFCGYSLVGNHWNYEQVDPSTLPKDPNTDWEVGISTFFLQILYTVTVGLASAIMVAAGWLLSLAVHISLDGSIYGLDFISQGWTVARDLANMGFIFIIIYLAFTVMFDANTPETMRRLGRVLAIALVINFSFFGTRVVIDAGNLLSVQFYNAIAKDASVTPVPTPQGVQFQRTAGFGVAPDITSKIVTGVDFKSALGPDGFKAATTNQGGDVFGALFVGFIFLDVVLAVMLLLLAAAFVAAGVKFIMRIVSLWLCIVASPIALVEWSLKKGHGGHGGGHGDGNFLTFDGWLSRLVGNAFYPALFLFIMLLISNFMESIGAGGTGGFGGGAIEQAVNTAQTNPVAAFGAILANVGVRLGLVLVLLYYALEAGKFFDMDIIGSAWGNTFGNNAVFGLPAWAARNTIGRGAAALQNTALGSARSPLRPLLNTTARGSFDVRATPGLSRLGTGEAGGEGGFLAGSRARREAKQDKSDEKVVHDAILNPQGVSSHEKEHLAHVSPETLSKFSPKDLEVLGQLVKEDMVKKAEGSNLLTQAAKDALRKGWKENSSESPQGRVNEGAGILRELLATNQEMKWVSETGLKKVVDKLQKGQTISLDESARLQQAFRNANSAASEDLKKRNRAHKKTEAAYDPAKTKYENAKAKYAATSDPADKAAMQQARIAYDDAANRLNVARREFIESTHEQRSAAEGMKEMNSIAEIIRKEASKSVEITKD